MTVSRTFIFSQIPRDRHLRLLRHPPRDRHLRLLRQPPSRDRHLWPSKSSVRGFGYDYDYGYGYVKSVDSMDNVNSVRSAGPIVNSMDKINNSAVILFTAAAPRE